MASRMSHSSDAHALLIDYAIIGIFSLGRFGLASWRDFVLPDSCLAVKHFLRKNKKKFYS